MHDVKDNAFNLNDVQIQYKTGGGFKFEAFLELKDEEDEGFKGITASGPDLAGAINRLGQAYIDYKDKKREDRIRAAERGI